MINNINKWQEEIQICINDVEHLGRWC